MRKTFQLSSDTPPECRPLSPSPGTPAEGRHFSPSPGTPGEGRGGGLLSACQRRFERARSGSVLVLVVALLVLVVLIGAAYVATARTERYATASDASNAQIDLILQGVLNEVQGAVIGDLWDNNPASYTYGQYRPSNPVFNASSTPPYSSYAHYTSAIPVPGYNSFNAPSSLWLGRRIPEPVPVGANSPLGYGWYAISYPVVGGVLPMPSPETRGSDPTTLPSSAGTLAFSYPIPDNVGNYSQYLTLPKHQYMATTWTPPGSTVVYPALEDLTTGVISLAADADGDGIADSGLFRLPVGPINGLTWYAAVRIIDNNSAVNVNTAQGGWYGAGNSVVSDPELDQSGLAQNNTQYRFVGYWPSSVQLYCLLTDTGTEPANLTQFKLNCVQNGTTNYNPNFLDNNQTPGYARPVDDPLIQTERSDFHFLSWGDVLWNMQGRRLDNPGNFITQDTALSGNNAPMAYRRFQAYGWSSAAALAAGFCIRFPFNTPSLIEYHLRKSVYDYVPLSPYPPADTSYWWLTNFNFHTGGTNNGNSFYNPYSNPSNTNPNSVDTPVKAILTARNPVSLAVQAHPMGAPGDTNPDSSSPYTICQQYPEATTAVTAGMTGMTLHPGPNTPSTPCKVSINTAQFSDLWWGFWNVMCSDDRAASGQAILDRPPFGRTPYNSDLEMFRNPIRDYTGTWTLTTSDINGTNGGSTMMLRAAMAAINALNLRHGRQPQISSNNNSTLTNPSPPDVLSRKIVIPAFRNGTTRTPMEVMLYGVVPQPYITEVYCNSDTYTTVQQTVNGIPVPCNNPAGYVAIELFNPYPFNLTMSNWKIGIINRAATGTATLSEVSAPTVPPLTASIPASTPPMSQYFYEASQQYPDAAWSYVPANGFLVLESYHDPYNCDTNPGDAATPANGQFPSPVQILGTTVMAAPTGKNSMYRPGPVNSSMALFNNNNGNGSSTAVTTGASINVQWQGRAANGGQSGVAPKHWFVNDLTDVLPKTDATGKLIAGTGGEFVLLRPHTAGNNLTNALDGTYNEITAPGGTNWSCNIQDMVPVDSYDFTGFNVPPQAYYQSNTAAQAYAWHYARANSPSRYTPSGNATSYAWQMVHPGPYYLSAGRYASSVAGQVALMAAGTITAPRFIGTVVESPWTPAGNSQTTEPWIASIASQTIHYNLQPWPFVNFTPRALSFGGSHDTINGSPLATYPLNYLPIQVVGLDWGDPTRSSNQLISNNANQKYQYFPFGGIPRLGEVLNVPFIGGYRIRPVGAAPGQLVEFSPVTMDALFADDDDVTDDTAGENIGRFCPIHPYDSGGAPSSGSQADDYSSNPSQWRYHFGQRLFDYFTTQSNPNDDYLPNIDPNNEPNTGFPPYLGLALGGQNPSPIANSDATKYNTSMALNTNENNVGVDGLINVNTANWKVLSTLPLVMTNTSGGEYDNNHWNSDNVAKAIVYYRDVDDGSVPGQRHPHGPFTSLFDLGRVWDTLNGSDDANHNNFRNAWKNLDSNRYNTSPFDTDPNNYIGGNSGKYTPSDYSNGNTNGGESISNGGGNVFGYNSTENNGIRSTYEEKFLALTRISNLITLRSDTFTAYIVIQGWQNAGTPGATMVVQRRAAVIIDRSGATPTNKSVKVYQVPSN